MNYLLAILISFFLFHANGQISISTGAVLRFEGYSHEDEGKIKAYYTLGTDYKIQKWRIAAELSYLPKSFKVSEQQFVGIYQGGFASSSDETTSTFSADVKYAYLGILLGGSRIFTTKELDNFQFSIGLHAQMDVLVKEKETNHQVEIVNVHSSTPPLGSPNPTTTVTTTYYPISYDEFNAITLTDIFPSLVLNTGYRFYKRNFFIHYNLSTGLNARPRATNELHDAYSGINRFKARELFRTGYYLFFQCGLKLGYTFSSNKGESESN